MTEKELSRLTNVSRPGKLIKKLGPVRQFIESRPGRGHGHTLRLD